MLASKSLLSIFITAHGAGRVGKGTLLSWLSGLQLWHVINGAPWNGGARLSRAVKGAASFAPSSSFHAPRLPITIHHLHLLKQDLDVTNTFDAAIWAVACIAFWSQCRLAEVCIDTVFDPKVHASRSSPLKSGFTANGVEFGSFFAPSTKPNHAANGFAGLILVASAALSLLSKITGSLTKTSLLALPCLCLKQLMTHGRR